ncbi:MAG: hypothetical protein IKS55_02760 [Oscillospiraceae bacterium]|nr:hypothetical protein [Oscillospiraceae bacterium]
MTTIREWRNEAWETGDKARDQHNLRYMMKKIMDGADEIENTPTPGHSKEDISRVIICRSSLLPEFEYIIHVNGFTVEDITEIHSH